MYDPKQFLSKRVYTDSELELLRTMVTCKTLTEAECYSIMEQAVAPCPQISQVLKEFDALREHSHTQQKAEVVEPGD